MKNEDFKKRNEKEILFVLQKIKKLLTFAPKNELLLYRIKELFRKNRGRPKHKAIDPAKEDEIIYKLKEWGAVKIEDRDRLENGIDFYLKTQPKFDEIYNLFKPKTLKETGQKQPTKIFDISKINYGSALISLRFSYQIILDILYTIGSFPIGFPDERINRLYITNHQLISKILERNDFQELKKTKPNIYDGLLGNWIDIVETWNLTRDKYYSFLDEIEKEFIFSRIKSDKSSISEEAKERSNNVNKILLDYRKRCITFVKQDDKRTDELRKKQLELEKNEEIKNKFLITFVQDGDRGKLKIEDFNPITFQTLRCELINFFYNSDDRKNWKSYKDIKQSISGHNTETIRKSIEKINERVAKRTKNKYTEIITSKTDEEVFNSTKSYRWKF